MTLAELYTALEGLEKGSEFINVIKAEISRLNGEAQKHRTAKEKAEGDRTALEAKVAELEEKGTGAGTEVAKLQTQMDALQKKYEDAEKKRVEAENARIHAEITQQAIDALTHGNAADPKVIAGLIVPKVKVGDDGSYSYTKDDGTTVSIADGTKEWLASNAWAVKDGQKGGSGRGVGTQSGSNSESKPVGLRAAVEAKLSGDLE